MDKIKTYCKKNKLFVIVMVIGLILAFLQISQVVMYADDYSLGTVSRRSGVAGAWQYFKDNYVSWGGGWTGFEVICLLTVGIKLWYILEFLIIFALIGTIIKIGKFDTDKEKAIAAIITWSLYFIVSLNISREAFLWVDGSFAYCLTTLELVFYIYLLYTRVNFKESRKKYDYVLLPIVALFAGWSTAQPGAMAVVSTIVILGFTKLFNKKEIPKFYYFCGLLAIFGYAIFYFAPGNAARLHATEPFFESLDVYSRILFKASSLFSLLFEFVDNPFTGIPFYLYLVMILLLIGSLYFIKNEKNKKAKLLLTIVSVYNLLFLLMVLYIRFDLPNSTSLNIFLTYKDLYDLRGNGLLSIFELIPYGIAGLSILCTVVQAGYISIKRKESILFIFVGCGLLAQIIMLLAPTHPSRTLAISVILLITAIVLLIKYLSSYKLPWYYAIVFILTMYNVNIGLLILILIFVASKVLKYLEIEKFNYEMFVIIAVLFMVAFGNYAQITYNYRLNKKTDKENVAAIENYIKEPNPEKTIVFKRYIAGYGNTTMIGVNWVERDAKTFFGLDPDVIFVYEDELQTKIEEEQ